VTSPKYLQQLANGRQLERAGDLSGAEQEYLKALEESRAMPAGSVAELDPLLTLEQFYKSHRFPRKGLQVANRLIAIWSQAAGSNAPGIAQYLSASGTFSMETGDYGAADEAFRRAQLILVTLRDTDPAAVAYVSGKLGNTLALEKRTEEAEHEFLNALSIMERTFGRNGPWISIALDYQKFMKESGLLSKISDLDADLEKAKSAKAPGSGVSHPELIHKREPEYTQQARQLRLSGDLSASLLVTSEGKADNIHVLEPLGFGLDKNAVKALKQWSFRPATRNGKPIPFYATVSISFRLY
jgi:TonB family protein